MSGPVLAVKPHALLAEVVGGHGKASCSCRHWAWVCCAPGADWPGDRVVASHLAHTQRQADFDAIADALDHPGHRAEFRRAIDALARLRGAS